MLPDRTTRLVDLQGLHREVMKNALDTYTAELKAIEKKADKNGVHTDVERLKRGVNLLKFCIGARASADDGNGDDDTNGAGAVDSEDDLWDAAGDEDPLEPEGVNLDDDEVIVTMLLLVDGNIPDASEEQIRAAVKGWDAAARREVYRWSRAIQLSASDHEDIVIPAKPKAIPLDWVGQLIRASIEKGYIDEKTLHPIGLEGPQIDYWLEQGPWRAVEYSVQDEPQPGEEPTPARIEFAVEWGETVAEGASTPLHPFAYNTREEGREVAARLNRKLRTESTESAHVAEVEGEPLGINEALLTVELQEVVLGEIAPGEKASALGIGAIRKWYRAGPWAVEHFEGERWRIVKDNGNGVFVGALTNYDVYEAHARAAVMNRRDFVGTANGGDPHVAPGKTEPVVDETIPAAAPPASSTNEAAAAVTDGKKKKAEKKKSGGKKQ